MKCKDAQCDKISGKQHLKMTHKNMKLPINFHTKNYCRIVCIRSVKYTTKAKIMESDVNSDEARNS